MSRVLFVSLICALAVINASAESNRRDYLEEVVVTAQKRSESIQDVPLSVSVLSADRIEASAMESFEDISLASPNTEINMTPGYVQVGMRGLNSPINDGMEQSVGFYVDGIYYGKTAFLQDAFLDLARVEMLKGPQGTLFGKNTVAGAINVTSAQPEMEWRGAITAGTGRDNLEKYTAILNVPLLADRMALRFAGTRHHRDGFVRNNLRGVDEKVIDKKGLRARLLFDVTDTLALVLTQYRGEANDNGQGWEPFVLQDDARQVHGAYNPALEARFDYVSHANSDNLNTSKTRVTNLQADWRLGEHLITGIFSDARATERLYLDADTASAPIADWDRRTDYDQQMVELRWTSPPGQLEYIVGLFGFESENDLVGDLTSFPEGPIDSVVLDAIGQSEFNALFAASGGGLLDEGLSGASTDSLHQTFLQKTRTIALFTQLSWHINDRLSLILGLRSSRETKKVLLDQDYQNSGIALQAAFGVTEYELDTERDESNTAPKISLKYELGDDDLLYASYAEGFKAGGFNPLARTADESSFDQETAQAFEIGYKMTALEGALTLNTAIYQTTFSDMQIQAFIGNGFIVNNAAEATTRGIELDLNFQPWAGTSIFASWGFTDATFDEYRDGPCRAGDESETCDLSGERLPRAPRYSASAGFNAAVPIWANRLAVIIGADLSWRDHILFDLDGDPIDAQDEYHLLNLHLGVADSDGRWSLMAHAKNVEDKTVRQFAADLPVFDQSHMGFLMPGRMFSADLKYNF